MPFEPQADGEIVDAGSVNLFDSACPHYLTHVYKNRLWSTPARSHPDRINALCQLIHIECRREQLTQLSSTTRIEQKAVTG
jgi:hypothetical protein